MNFILIGAVESSAHALEAFIRHGLKPALLCTLPPGLAARHSDYVDLQPIAAAHGIPVLHVDNVNDASVLQDFRALFPDYIFVIGWSQLLKRDLLDLPRKGCVGFHPALLPKFRGRAALPWTILLGEETAGATLFYLDSGADSGPIIAQEAFSVSPEETARSLYDKVQQALDRMIASIAPLLSQDAPLPSRVQDEAQASYLAKRVPQDGWIDWHESAQNIWTLVRAAGKPYPGAFTVFHDKKLTIWSAEPRTHYNHIGVPGQILTINPSGVTVQCATGWLDIQLIQEEDKPEMNAARYFTRPHDRLGVNMADLWTRRVGKNP